jgi:hypothetical protein
VADETVVPIDDNAAKRYRRKGSLLNEAQLKRRRIMYCESYQTYEFRILGGSSILERYIHSGKPYEGKPHVRFDEGARETGYNSHCALVLLYNYFT